MKVLHILYELKFSGAEIMYVDAASLFQDCGCELTVIATSPNLGVYAGHFRNVGYEVIHKPYPIDWNVWKRIRYYIEFIQFLKKNKFDVIHLHTFMWAFAFCAWIARKRSVYTFHAVFHSHFYSYFYHVWQRWSAKNIFGCKFQSISDTVFEHELTYYHNKTKKIYNWYGTHRFYPAQEEEKQRIRMEMDIPIEELVLISIGGCSEVKRHSDIIMALPHIIKKHPSVMYLHLGDGHTLNGEKELAIQLGVEKHIRFCGNQTDVRRFLLASDIYIMTSKNEGISITTIEAMACGIPAILYDVPGLRDFNKNGENCCLIPEDYKILAEKVIELHNNPEDSARFSANARELVSNTYHMEKNVPEIFNLYSM